MTVHAMIVPAAVIEYVIFIEIIAVIVIILFTYLLKLYYNFKLHQDKKINDEIERFLKTTIAKKSSFTKENFPSRWKRLDILLPIIFKHDQSDVNNPAWNEIKEKLTKEIVLPLARKKYDSRFWLNRLLAAQAFGLHMEKPDENLVDKLIQDKVPIVHLYAVVAATKFGSEVLVNRAIDSMAAKRRLGQTIYLRIFENAPLQARTFIENRLAKEKDPFTRASSYKILLNFPPSDNPVDYNPDLYSENIELRLAALRYAAYEKKAEAIPLLTSLLSDQHWEVKAISLRLLGELKAKQAVSSIAEHIKDPVWWVRVNAANALKNLGDEGQQILKEQDPNSDVFAYETAMHVLHKPSFLK